MEFVPLSDASEEVKNRILELRNQPNVRKFMYTDHEITAEEHQGWIASLSGNSKQQVFAVINEGKTAGLVSLGSINERQKSAEWAFYLDEALQGAGIGSRVEFKLLDYAFNEAGLEKLNCEVLETNFPVVRLHEKFGFVREGVRRKNVIKDGERIDVVLLGILKDEWAIARARVLPAIERASRK